MINVGVVYKNLKTQLNKKADEDYIEFLKKLVNYTDENKFKDHNKLISAIKYSSENDEVVYCITTLNKIKQVIEMNELPVAESSDSITLGEYIDWLIENDKPSRKKQSMLKSRQRLEKIKSKPLKLSDKEYYDWIELNLDLELTRHVCE